MQQFKPEEIKVKVVDDFIVVEGKHEERQDKHGYISRQFTRRYKLPPNVNLEAVKSSLSSDGVLSIAAPKKVCSTVLLLKLLYLSGGVRVDYDCTICYRRLKTEGPVKFQLFRLISQLLSNHLKRIKLKEWKRNFQP